MAKFRKDSLKAGTYRGQKFDEARFTRFRDQFREMKKLGLGVPLLYEHAEPGSEHGAPQRNVTPRDKAADRVKHGAGWIDDIEVENGQLVFKLDADANASKKLKDGTIKFVSPEIRSEFDAGDQKFTDVITHVALTHHPVARDQQPAIALSCLQLSVDDLEPEDKTTDGKGSGEPATADEAEVTGVGPEETEEGISDKPKDEAVAEEFKNLLLQLESIGLPLGEMTTPETLQHDLLIAVKVKQASEQKAEEETAKDEDPEKPGKQLMQQQPDVALSAEAKTLLGVLTKEKQASATSRLDVLKKQGRVSDLVHKAIAGKLSTLQLSAAGKEQNSFTAAEVIDLLEKGTVALLDSTQLSTEAHHNPGFHSRDGEGQLTREEAERLASKFIKGGR